MKVLWVIYSGFLLLPLIEALVIIPPVSLDGADGNTSNTLTDLGSIKYGKQIQSDTKKSSLFAGGQINEQFLAACREIEMNISSASQVFYPINPEYYIDISHYATSSNMLSACTVEPATANDVAIIINVIRKNRVPYAVKGGGHSLNPGFSSTDGVLIAMRRFRKTVFHPNNQTVDVGAGLVWDDVYKALVPYNVSVLGGRVTGVGVAGFTLGGGYGWKSNQYGLTIDNVFEYELVAPDGNIVYVNNQSYPDIFFGLKGGFNNFGIVTNFNMRALPQTLVYGGLFIYTQLQYDQVLTATSNFQNNNKDPKAEIISSITVEADASNLNVIFFYDAPIAPSSVFKEFEEILHIGVLRTLSYLSLVKSSPLFTTEGMRGRFHTVSVTNFTTGLLNKVKELSNVIYTTKLLSRGGTLLTFNIEPFLPTYFDKSLGGAYPHVPSSTPLLPINIFYAWQLSINDQFFITEIQSAADSLLQTAVAEGQDVGGVNQIRYTNYAIAGTPLSEVYGPNLNRLKTIRQAWDPENVTYLAGGFKL